MDRLTELLLLSSDPPSKPLHLLYDNQTKTTIDLSWACPADDGGSPITGYVIERCDKADDKGLWEKAATVSGRDTKSCKVEDLIENEEYAFRVCAVNKAGKGAPSDATQFIKAQEKPSRPFSCLYNTHNS